MKRHHRPIRRKGSLFHYYMMYLFLTSVFLTVGGVCLHTLLKADRTDTLVATHLKQLWRLDVELRAACAEATTVEVTDNSVFVINSDTETQTWSVDESTLLANTVAAGETVSRQRYIFGRGSKITCTSDSGLLTLTVSDPRALTTANRENSSAADGHMPTKQTEIIVAIPVKQNTGGSDE